jgi:hypothetical protein
MFRALRNFLLLSLIFLILPTFCLAQSINTAASLQNELGVEISPDYPGPNKKVSISLSLFTDDLNSATIVWYLNDQKVLEGVGETKYSFKMGQAGKSTKVDIKIKLLSGVSFSKTFTLNPASVDLVWEANSYVPPFYKGKALFSYQSSFKIVATPNFIRNGKLIPAEKLVYEWSNNNSAYQNQSGYGKNVLILNGSVLGREEEIDLLVTDPNSNLVANGFINLRPTEPEIVFYQNDPYYGQIFDNTSSNIFDLKKEEIQFHVPKRTQGSVRSH